MQYIRGSDSELWMRYYTVYFHLVGQPAAAVFLGCVANRSLQTLHKYASTKLWILMTVASVDSFYY